MGSVMDRERPWEEAHRLESYRIMPLDKLEQEINELSELPWERVAYRQAKEILEERIKINE